MDEPVLLLEPSDQHDLKPYKEGLEEGCVPTYPFRVVDLDAGRENAD